MSIDNPNKMSEKKLYYKYEPSNGEPYCITSSIEDLKAMIEGEFHEIKQEGEDSDIEPEIVITFLWLTDQEYSELPEID